MARPKQSDAVSRRPKLAPERRWGRRAAAERRRSSSDASATEPAQRCKRSSQGGLLEKPCPLVCGLSQLVEREDGGDPATWPIRLCNVGSSSRQARLLSVHHLEVVHAIEKQSLRLAACVACERRRECDSAC